MKHTPGPWIAGDDEDSDLFLVGPESYPGLVTSPIVRLHSEADARLIAAAPELLAALSELLPMFAEWHSHFPEHVGDKETPALQLARAAIAKATN